MAKKVKHEVATKEEVKEAVVEIAENTSEIKKRKFPKINLPKKFFLYFGIAVIVVAASGISGFFYLKYQEQIEKTKVLGSSFNSLAATEDLINKVSKIAELPGSEVPTIATVSDRNQLAGQPFFEKAENGDKVLIYQASKTAYLYRPSSGKIINIGPVNVPSGAPVLGATTTNASSSSNTAPVVTEAIKQAKVLLLNGTSATGLTRIAESELGDDNVSGIIIADRDNSKNGGYEKTIVVDLKGKAKTQAELIAESLGGSVAPLPDGEEVPEEIDIVVILGASYVK